MNSNEILVEVAYALAHEQLIVPVKAAPGITAEQAINLSGIVKKYPEIDLSQNKVGILASSLDWISPCVT